MARSLSARQHICLLEAPSPWLSQVVRTVGSATKLVLFQTCRQLRDLVLANTFKVQLTMSPSRGPTGMAAASCLQLLKSCREGTDVYLIVKAVSWDDGVDDEDVAVVTTEWLSSLGAAACSGRGLPLHLVKRLVVQGIILGDLLPTALIHACCSLQHLTRPGRFPSNPRADFTPVNFPQLQSLTLTDVPPDAGGISAQDLALQLHNLPNIQELHAESTWAEDVDDGWDEPEAGPFWAEVAKPLRTRLVALGLRDSMLLLPLFSAPWPHLQRIDMPLVWLTDDHVDHLLRYAPQLRVLKVQSFLITGSYSSRQCQWQHVTILDKITTQQLASLPVSNLHSLHLKMLEARQYDVSQLESARRHLTACKKMTSLRSDGTFQVLFGVPSTWEEPLLPSMVALLQSLGNTPLRVGIPSHVLLEASSASLLEQLPQLQLLDCDPHNAAGAAVDFQQLLVRLQDLCAKATSPVQLKLTSVIERHLEPSWKLQLAEAMRAAGHQHVTIVVNGPVVRSEWCMPR